MDWPERQIACKQLNIKLQKLQNMIIPGEGWTKTLRKLLGMTSTQLAHKCGVSKQRILQIEKDEKLKNTTLTTLEHVAKNLGCKLVYAFVPEGTLLELIDNAAEIKALEKLASLSHSMALEEQRVEGKAHKDQIKLLKDQLIRNNIKSIWE